MGYFKKIKLNNFKNFKSYEREFSKNCNVFFGENGFDVTAVDYSIGAVNHLNSVILERKLNIKVLNLDFFELNSTHDCLYDLLIEQTFFCAISPSQRPLYAETVARILKKGGMIVGLFYHTGQEGGPPFNTTRQDIIKHFSGLFEIRELTQAKNSAEKRKGKENRQKRNRKKTSIIYCPTRKMIFIVY